VASNEVDPGTVVWIAPESVVTEGFAEELADATTAEEVTDILSNRPTPVGQYREVTGEEPVAGPAGTTILAPTYGDLLVWVNDSPEDDEDPGGHFERFDGDPADYQPTRSA
jgi:hypothetical protein